MMQRTPIHPTPRLFAQGRKKTKTYGVRLIPDNSNPLSLCWLLSFCLSRSLIRVSLSCSVLARLTSQGLPRAPLPSDCWLSQNTWVTIPAAPPRSYPLAGWPTHPNFPRTFPFQHWKSHFPRASSVPGKPRWLITLSTDFLFQTSSFSWVQGKVLSLHLHLFTSFPLFNLLQSPPKRSH